MDTLFDALGAPSAAETQLYGRLDASFTAIAADWGAAPIELAAFAEALAQRLRAQLPEPEPSVFSEARHAALERLALADLYLAARCEAHDQAALQRLESRCIAPLTSVLARIDPTSTFIDDIKQQVRTKLLVAGEGRKAKIQSYAGRGPLDAWIRIIAVREALSEKRKIAPWRSPDAELLDVEASVTSPELGVIKQQYRVEFERALREAMAGLEPQQRNLLRHHYLHGLSFDEIAKIYAMHRSSVARHIAKARKLLLAHTRRALAVALSMDHAEFERLLELIASRIDLSIERLLDAGTGSS